MVNRGANFSDMEVSRSGGKKKFLDSEQHTYVCDQTEPSSSFHSSFLPVNSLWMTFPSVFPDVLLICENNIWPFEIFKDLVGHTSIL